MASSQTRTRLLAIPALVVCGLVASACTFRLGDGKGKGFDDDDLDTSSSGSYSSGAYSSGSGGATGSGGSSGSGDPDYSTGAGGDPVDPWCVAEEGMGWTAQVCEEMAITPGESATCGANGDEVPLGYSACYRAFEIYMPGHAEYLASCLSDIAASDACEVDPVGACVDDLYQTSCERPEINDLCASFDEACSAYGDEHFDVAQCSFELAPFNENAVADLGACMNDESIEGDCQYRYDVCFEETISAY